MIELAIQILLVILAGAFAVGSVIVYAEMKTSKRSDLDNHFRKPPLQGEGQFDKQRTQYTEGDNT
jgi:hypothetical protein|tara:strand:+ start:451 stop:645 length:195 start_codon:yes stop_codon:yes gene_type:complete